jgi:hypothetical protein
MATIAIGDIHGNRPAVEDLLDQIKGEVGDGDVVVFLGDLPDQQFFQSARHEISCGLTRHAADGARDIGCAAADTWPFSPRSSSGR